MRKLLVPRRARYVQAHRPLLKVEDMLTLAVFSKELGENRVLPTRKNSGELHGSGMRSLEAATGASSLCHMKHVNKVLVTFIRTCQRTS